MAQERHKSGNWSWIEMAGRPAAVIDCSTATFLAANLQLVELLEQDRADLIGSSTDIMIPDFLLPSGETVSEWIAAVEIGQIVGSQVELFIEPPGVGPITASARLGPASPSNDHALIICEEVRSKSDFTAPSDGVSALLGDIGRMVSSSLDMTGLCKEFSLAIMQAVPVDHVEIFVKRNDSAELKLAFTNDTCGDSVLITGPSSPVRECFERASSLLLTGDSVLQTEHRAGNCSATRITSSVCMPMIAGSETIGVAFIGTSSIDFGREDLSLLEKASYAAAGAARNILLNQSLQRRNNEVELLARISRIASQSVHFDQNLPEIAAVLSKFATVLGIEVHDYERDSGSLIQAYICDLTSALEYESSTDPTLLDCERKRAISENGVVTEKMHVADRDAILVVAALREDDEPKGTLTVLFDGSVDDEQELRRITALVASQIAGPVRATQAYQDQREEAQLRRGLATIASEAGRDLQLLRVLERTAVELSNFVEFDYIAFALINQDDPPRLAVEYHVGPYQIAELYDDIIVSKTRLFEWRNRLLCGDEIVESFPVIPKGVMSELMEISIGYPESGANGYVVLGRRFGETFSSGVLNTLTKLSKHITPPVMNAVSHERDLALVEALRSEFESETRKNELERVNEAKDRFLGIVSHELRTPLTSIMAYTELLIQNKSQNLSEKQSSRLGVISKSAQHLRALISDLLDTSSIESGQFVLEISEFDLAELLTELVERFEAVLETRTQVLEFSSPSHPVYIKGDRRRLGQVFGNLIENASKYSGPNSTVSLSISRQRDKYVVVIADQGVGIDAESQGHLFQPFFRVNTELTRKVAGTGLGLALVKSIVELHEGEIKVESEEGEGSQFIVVLNSSGARAAA